jgi:integrase
MVMQNSSMMISMNARTATLVIRYKAPDGRWQRGPVAIGGNGRIRQGFAIIDGQPIKVAEFNYQVRTYEGRQAKYTPAGKNASDAEAKRAVLESQVSIKAQAAGANLTVVEAPARKTLAGSATAYIKQKEDAHLTEAVLQARNVTEEFLKHTKKRFIDEITTDDITRFHNVLRKRSCGPRTVANKHARLVSWLKFAGVDPKLFPPKPVFEKALPTIYSSEQIGKLLATENPYMRMVMLVALKLGLRDQELRHIEFSDIDKQEKTLRVRGKLKWNFHVKQYEQRDIPIPDDLYEELLDWERRHPTQTLILATSNGRPNRRLLQALKRVARRVELNCSRCDGCKSAYRECEEYSLHRFRRTYITNLLRSGIDLRTVQHFAGHKDLQSTMRYLRPAATSEARAKINAVKW